VRWLLCLLQLVNKAAAKFDQMQLTSFLDAAASGDVDVVQDMLRQGMNPNTADYDGRTALMIAAYKGCKVGFLAFVLDCGHGQGVLQQRLQRQHCQLL
jgi:ankyrin repeat protein